jgi:hypothetical protein
MPMNFVERYQMTSQLLMESLRGRIIFKVYFTAASLDVGTQSLNVSDLELTARSQSRMNFLNFFQNCNFSSSSQGITRRWYIFEMTFQQSLHYFRSSRNLKFLLRLILVCRQKNEEKKIWDLKKNQAVLRSWLLSKRSCKKRIKIWQRSL